MNRTLWISALVTTALWAGCAPCACGAPVDVAITHLKKIADGEVDLDVGADTAISPHVGPGKKSEIEGRIKRMALDLAGGELEPGEIRIDGDLAGVIIHKSEGYDPEKTAAFAVALVKSGERWIPTPVAASFENTGVSVHLETRRRAAALERWMLRERTRALDVLRDERAGRMRRDIGTAITREQLVSKSVGEMAQAFLDACRSGDRLRLLGMLGGLSDPLPQDWATRLHAVDQALDDPDHTPGAWRALTSPEVPRAIVLEETGVRDGLFTIGFLDPAGEVPRGGVPAVGLLHIGMQRDPGGAWRLNLPAGFMQAPDTENFFRADDNPFDNELLDAFPAKLRQAHPAAAQESAEALWMRMREVVKNNSPDELLRLLALPEDDAKAARQSVGRAARFWWQLRAANGGRSIVPLSFHQDGDQAMAMVQLHAFREPERTDLRAFHMVRLDDGWLWQSTGRGEPQRPISEALVAWRDEQEEHWRTQWINAVLTPVARLKRIVPDSPVDAAAAAQLARNLLDAIAAGDLDACLRHCAVLDDQEGHARLLRNLGYELSTQLTGIEGEMVTRIGKHLAVVSYRRRDDVNSGMALLTVVATPDGPRILLELDLFVGTRQRDFLNNVALERLEAYADEEVRADLRNILQQLNREFAPAGKN